MKLYSSCGGGQKGIAGEGGAGGGGGVGVGIGCWGSRQSRREKFSQGGGPVDEVVQHLQGGEKGIAGEGGVQGGGGQAKDWSVRAI